KSVCSGSLVEPRARSAPSPREAQRSGERDGVRGLFLREPLTQFILWHYHCALSPLRGARARADSSLLITRMPAILLAVTGTDAQPWEARLRALAPQRDIRLWPDRLGEAADIAYVCAWHAPRGLFARLPKLKVIFSLGAGVDHIFADPD